MFSYALKIGITDGNLETKEFLLYGILTGLWEVT
jgi:hypothetical protein